ncbi:phospholipid scramblase 1-like protein [Dinothrombium tinctorium]|uniref:Phospholipid scramblase n=1 Tax=Dinothrombium tinctorium TaxID=1965070 RepID=A0A3S3PP35_9ACAR|nr:phospholipid scramblase 1-like protein [Dinothrombium tinctorium]
MSVITEQPKSISSWITIQKRHDNCPPGLEALIDADHLLVRQVMEFFEAVTGYETNNRYWIKNSAGANLFLAVEENDCLTRQCSGSLRPFLINFKDASNVTVAQAYRPMRCDTCCCPFCLQELEMMAPEAHTIGWTEQAFTCCYPKFKIKNRERDKTKLTITGPLWTCSCFYEDVEFNVYSAGGDKIGRITKHWSGFFKELFTDSDIFGISFPKDLDIELKIVLLGTVLLIDYMFFEDPACGKRKDVPGMCC